MHAFRSRAGLLGRRGRRRRLRLQEALGALQLAVALPRAQHHLQQRRRRACLQAWHQAARRGRRNARVAAARLRQQALQLQGVCFDGWLRVVVGHQGHGQLQRALGLERALGQAGAELRAEQLGQAAALQQVQLLELQQAQLQQELLGAGAGAASGAGAEEQAPPLRQQHRPACQTSRRLFCRLPGATA
jgi:hypothetical protein